MNNRVMAVERGEVDAMPFFDSLREVKRLSGDKNLVVTNKGYAGIGSLDWVAFNTGKKPFDDVRVRQAAAYDLNFFAKVIMMGLVTPSATPITPFSPFYTKDVNMYDVNLEKAKKLLDEAGYPVKADGTRFTVTVDYAPGSPTTKMMAEYLKPASTPRSAFLPTSARGPNGCPTTTSTSPPTTCSTGAIPSSACTARIPPPTS